MKFPNRLHAIPNSFRTVSKQSQNSLKQSGHKEGISKFANKSHRVVKSLQSFQTVSKQAPIYFKLRTILFMWLVFTELFHGKKKIYINMKIQKNLYKYLKFNIFNLVWIAWSLSLFENFWNSVRINSIRTGFEESPNSLQIVSSSKQT